MILLAVLLVKVFALAALVMLYRRRWLAAEAAVTHAVALQQSAEDRRVVAAAYAKEAMYRLDEIAAITRRVPRRHFIATARRIARAVEGV